MRSWIPICRVEDIPVLGSRRVSRDNATDVAIFRNAEDKVFALLDRCPHKGGPLSQGIVFGESVACPLHNWTIGLADGCAKTPDEGCTPRFAVKVELGQVSLDEQELRSLALGAFTSADIQADIQAVTPDNGDERAEPPASAPLSGTVLG